MHPQQKTRLQDFVSGTCKAIAGRSTRSLQTRSPRTNEQRQLHTHPPSKDISNPPTRRSERHPHRQTSHSTSSSRVAPPLCRHSRHWRLVGALLRCLLRQSPLSLPLLCSLGSEIVPNAKDRDEAHQKSDKGYGLENDRQGRRSTASHSLTSRSRTRITSMRERPLDLYVMAAASRREVVDHCGARGKFERSNRRTSSTSWPIQSCLSSTIPNTFIYSTLPGSVNTLTPGIVGGNSFHFHSSLLSPSPEPRA